jgi:iron complex transport system permease protein
MRTSTSPPRSAADGMNGTAARTAGHWTVLVLAALGLVFAGMVVATVALGSVAIPLADVVGVVTGGDVDANWAFIVNQVRLPRAATAAVAGAALGIGGLQMQTLFRNPLADPYILGLSSGASLGVALVVLTAGTGGTALVGGLGLGGNVGVAGAAAVGAGLVTMLVLAISRRVASPATVLIIGLMVGYAVTAVVSVLIHSGLGQFERVRAYIAWGFGSFAGTSWPQLRVLALAVAIGLTLTLLTIKPLNALLLGESYAQTMGVRVGRTRLLLVGSTALLAGAVTAFCGPIAFIGVAAPHLARGLLRSSDHRVLVPGVMLVGAIVALVAGLVAQLPGQDAALPLNAVTALVGAPVVVAILLRMRRSAQAVVT